MKQRRTIRSNVVDPDDDDPYEAAPGPQLNRRAFLAIAALGGGATVAGFGLSKLGVLGGSSSSASAATSGATTSTTPAAASATSTATVGGTAFGMGDVATDSLTITVADGYRNIATKSMPDHDIDPNFQYPGTPAAQSLNFKVTTDPQIASTPTFVQTGQVFGVQLNSVVFDPKTAGYYNNDMNGGWNYTAEVLDIYGAHTRPETGFYHYHRVTDQWASDSGVHSALVGWAADGFPVYLRYGYVEPTDSRSGVASLASSYRLKSGSRPSGSSDPGGTYDGTFVADYEFVDGLGDLDECNGRECVTPEFPDGTYAYFLSDEWPFVPNYLRGTPDQTFAPGFGGVSGLPT